MTTSLMKVTSDPQDQWSMETMAGCDGTLAEEGKHRRNSKRGLQSKEMRIKERGENEEILFFFIDHSFLINLADID